MHTRRTARAFTLVEILIVVVILGILAVMVVPKFTNAAENAKVSNLVTQLQSINHQLQIAQVQHQGVYPDLATSWSYLTEASDPTSTSGGAYTPADGDNDDVGPYLHAVPVNPFENSSSVASTPAAGVGWVYSQSTGTLTAVMSATAAAEVGLNNNNSVVTYSD